MVNTCCANALSRYFFKFSFASGSGQRISIHLPCLSININLGISHDGLGQKEVWKKFVAKKGWKNIELIANYNESVGKYYKVEGIPRLMIFDKEGRIVTVDAPKPSDPRFKKLIEETLKSSERASNP